MAYDKLVDSVELETRFKNIGDAIREKTGKNDLIDIVNMPDEIRSITGGSSEGLYCWRVSDEIISPFSLVPVMTADIDNGYEAFASSFTTGHEAFRAFDGVGNTGVWISKAAVPQYVGIHFPSPVTVSSFSVLNSNETDRAIKEFYLQGSNDGENWIDFGFYTNPNIASNKETFNVDVPASKSYWRLYITSNSSSTFPRIDQIEFYSDIATSFIVSDNPNAYPQDGFGTDGKYYLSTSVSSLSSGNSNNKVAYGTFTVAATTNVYTITHNLGVVPNFMVVFECNENSTTELAYFASAMRFDNKLVEALGLQYSLFSTLRKANTTGYNATFGKRAETGDITDETSNTGYTPIYSATETQVTVGHSNGARYFIPSNTYAWLAIGGVV